MKRSRAASRSRWAILAGVVAVYPFVWPLGVLRWREAGGLRRADFPWLLAMAAFGAVSLVHGALDPALPVAVGAFAAYRAGRGFALSADDAERHGARAGLVGAVVLLAAWAAWQTWGAGVGRASGPYWFGHPNQFAHASVALGIVVASSHRGRWRTIALVLTTMAIVSSGSRSGLVAWLLVQGLLAAQRGWRRPVAVVVALGAASMIVALAMDGGRPWSDRILAPVRLLLPAAPPKNELVSTEDLLDGTYWNHLGVTVQRVPGPGPAWWSVERHTDEPWARPQQRLAVEPGVAYSLAGEFAAPSGPPPGFLVWGRTESARLELRVALTDEGPIIGTATGVVVHEALVTEVGSGWRRLAVTFEIETADVPDVAVGPSPGVIGHLGVGDRVLVRSLQWERGEVATAYVPTPRIETGQGEALARLDLFDVALQGIAAAPLWGQGPGRFADFAVRTAEGRLAGSHHAHNLALDVAFRGGFVGIAGLVILLACLLVPAPAPVRAAFVGLLVANLVDATLISATVLFPLAWAAGRGHAATTGAQANLPSLFRRS